MGLLIYGERSLALKTNLREQWVTYTDLECKLIQVSGVGKGSVQFCLYKSYGMWGCNPGLTCRPYTRPRHKAGWVVRLTVSTPETFRHGVGLTQVGNEYLLSANR